MSATNAIGARTTSPSRKLEFSVIFSSSRRANRHRGMRPPDALRCAILPALHELQNSDRVKWLTTIRIGNLLCRLHGTMLDVFSRPLVAAGMIRSHQTEPTNDH